MGPIKQVCRRTSAVFLSVGLCLWALPAHSDDAGVPAKSPHELFIDMQATLIASLAIDQRAYVPARIVTKPMAMLREGLDGLRESIATYTALPEDKLAAILSPKELAAWKTLVKKASAFADSTGAALDAEEAIRVTPVVPLCQAHWMLDAALEAIRREKANPSGVVDLKVLHTEGENVQGAREEIARLTPEYVAVRNHPYSGWQSEGGCVEVTPANGQ